MGRGSGIDLVADVYGEPDFKLREQQWGHILWGMLGKVGSAVEFGSTAAFLCIKSKLNVYTGDLITFHGNFEKLCSEIIPF